MSYHAKKVEIINVNINENTKYELGIDEIETIEVNYAEKVIFLTYKDDTRKLKIIPYDGPIEITLLKEMKKARIHV